MNRQVLTKRVSARVVTKPVGVLTGPGTELKGILAAIGVYPILGCGCEDMARKMDLWGEDECKEHRQEIVTWMEGRVKAMMDSMTFLDPLDPFGSMVDEAIRRTKSN